MKIVPLEFNYEQFIKSILNYLKSPNEFFIKSTLQVIRNIAYNHIPIDDYLSREILDCLIPLLQSNNELIYIKTIELFSYFYKPIGNILYGTS